MFRSLAIRNYRLFASGQLVSLTGTWMQNVAQDWLVLDLTHRSGTALGVTTALQFLPMLLFGLWGGVFADRHDKRRVMLATQATQGTLAFSLGLLVVTGVVQTWMVFAFAFALGMTTVFDLPARQAFVVEMVGPDDVTNAVGLNSATFNSARIVGPAIAGLMIAHGGTPPVFFLNAASYLAVIVGLLRINEAELFPGRRVERAKGQLRAGLTYVRRRRDLLLPIVLVGVIGMVGLNFQITLALMARNEFHKDASTYGTLSALLAAGSLVGALLTARRKRPTQTVLLGSAIAFGVLETALGLMPNIVLFAIVLVPCGFAVITFTSTALSTVQIGAGEDMRGRVLALYALVFVGGTPFGAPVIGWLGQHVGPRSTLVVGGLGSLAVSLATGALLVRSGGRLPFRRARAVPPAPVPYEVVR
ncbi:MAG TPA: MFS transporter [Mycobacteriales bacterium]|jgi:MFS family permease|nr:MFS transporter [Mycobacteriales bacterium]